MAFTVDQYNRLNEAISLGALEVKYADKDITYRSLAEMITLKNLMERELGIAAGGIKTSFAKFSRGLNK